MISYLEKRFSALPEIIQDEVKNSDMNLDPKVYFNKGIKLYEKFMETFSDGGMKKAASEVKEEMEKMENTELHIAITGETGSGKSTLTNTLQGLKAADVGAAPVGLTETTKEPKSYSHPNYPKVKFWDLPGIGSPGFSAKSYFERVKYSEYDVFIIVSSTRFQQYHIDLALEIQRMNKLFYFVRSKLDVDMDNMKRDFPETFSKDQAIETIRDDCCKNLLNFKETNPQIFLISSLDLGEFDFGQLVDTLEKDLHHLKRIAFLLSLPNFSPEVTEKKKSALKSHIWKISLASAGINALPIPGLPLACDVGLLLASMVAFYKSFELDDDSLARLARLARKPVEELKAVMKSPQIEEITIDLVIKLLTNYEKGLFSCSLGTSLVAAGVSFATTWCMLLIFLNNLAEDAERVRKKALGLEDWRAQHTKPKQN